MLAPQQFSRTNIIIPAQEFSRINSKGAQAFSRTNNGCTECPPEQSWEWLLASVSSSCKCAGAQNPRCLAKPPTSGTSHSSELKLSSANPDLARDEIQIVHQGLFGPYMRSRLRISDVQILLIFLVHQFSCGCWNTSLTKRNITPANMAINEGKGSQCSWTPPCIYHGRCDFHALHDRIR